MIILDIPFLKRIIPSLIRRYKILTNPIINKFNLNGIQIDLDIRESLERKIFFEKKYEQENFEYLCKAIKKYQCNYFIDIGSNIGIYSLRIAKKFNNIEKIYAFEPLIDTFKKLKKNVSNNNLSDKINIYNYGLSSEKKITMGSLRYKGNLKQSAGFNIDLNGNTEIKVNKGDNIINFNNQSVSIKCDVEGHEMEVFKGLEKFITTNKCFIQVEVWKKNEKSLNNFFNTRGYKLVETILGEFYYTNN